MMRTMHSLYASLNWLLLGVSLAFCQISGGALPVLESGLIQKLQPPDDGVTAEDGFGLAMAIGGEWAVVGAPQDTCGVFEGAVGMSGFRSGAVYVYRLINGSWTYQQKIRGPEPRYNAFFGHALALSGGTFAVASKKYPTHEGFWSVQVYARTADGWSVEADLAMPGDLSSNAVLALEGNMLLVGNPESSGSVYAFERSGHVWTARGELNTGLSLTANSHFGTSLALSGTRAFVGAPGNVQQPGRIYEFTYSAGVWSLIRTISSPAGSVYDEFGRALAFQNGFLVAGAKQPTILGPTSFRPKTSGRVYIFSLEVSAWTLARTIERPSGITAIEWGEIVQPGNGRVILGANTDSGDGKAAFQSLEMTGSVPANWPLKALPNPLRRAFSSDGILASFGDLVWYMNRYNLFGIGTTGGYADRLSFANASWKSDGILPLPPASQLQKNPTVIEPAGQSIIVGTPSWSDDGTAFYGGTSPGMVHVYSSTHGRWQFGQTIRNPEEGNSVFRGFGQSIAYSKEQDKLAISSQGGRIYIYSRQADRMWSLSHRIAEISSNNFGFSMGWDGNLLHIFAFTGRQNETMITAYEADDDSATLVPSRSINLKEEFYPIVGENTLVSLSYPPGTSVNGAVVIRKHNGRKWVLSQREVLPPKAYNGQIYGLTSDSIVVKQMAGTNAGDPNLQEVLTSRFRSGQWQAFQKLKLPQSAGAAEYYDSTVATDGRSMLISAKEKTALAVITAGEWRFQRWLPFPSTDQSLTYSQSPFAVAGSSAATLGGESTSVLRHIEVMSLAQMDIHDGPATPATLIASGSSFDWKGPVLVGSQTSRRLTLRNSGPTTYQVQARIEGPHAADFQISGVPGGMLQPGDEEALTLTLKPGGTGLRAATLILTPTSDNVSEWTLDLSSQGANAVTIPASSENVHTAIIRLGNDAFVQPEVTGTRPFTVEWRKNGRLIKGLTQEYLWFPNTQPSDAGEYEMKVSNQAGAYSARVLVSVYDYQTNRIAVKSSAPLQLRSKFWGPGEISWSLPESSEILPAVYAGRLTPTLTILAPSAALKYAQLEGSSRDLKATLRIGDVSQTIAEYYLDNNLPPRILIVPRGSHILGTTIEGNGGVVAEYPPPVAGSFSAIGLPEGIGINSLDGVISGSFTKAGTYRVTWKLSNDFGSDSMSSVFTVADLPRRLPSPGIYAGLIADDLTEPSLDRPSGYVQIQMAGRGAFTGQWRFKGITKRFSGRYVLREIFGDQYGAIVPLGTVASDVLKAELQFVPISNDNDHSFDVTLVYRLANNTESGVYGRLSKVVRPSRYEQQLHTGLFSGLLNQPSSNGSIPQGTGISSLNISSDGSWANGVGTLADGQGFTFSSVLPANQIQDLPSIPVYFYDGSSKNTLFGWMPVSLESSLLWKRSPNPRSLSYPNGFHVTLSNQFLQRSGEAPQTLLLADSTSGSQNARLKADWNASTLLETSFTLTSAHTAVFPRPNSSRVRLDFYAPTGFFTGSFETAQDANTNGRTVFYRGMLLPGLNTGGGFFLLPKLAEPEARQAAKSSGSPILSGKVSISPNLRQ
jgi:Immunoglobulin I-set domain